MSSFADMTMPAIQAAPGEPGADAPGQAFSRLAREFYEPVYFFIARQVSNREDAADITQQVFLRGYKSFSRFDRGRDFAPWIFTIARRCIADHFRSRKAVTEEISESVADPDPDPGQVADSNDHAEQLWALASSLKPKQHQILLLHYKENFSMREVARIMGITTTHAKVLLFRARNALKQRLHANPALGGLLS